MAKHKKKSPPKPAKLLKRHLLPIILSLLLLLLTALTYQVVLTDKYYPLTFVGDTNISFLTEGQAIQKVQASFNHRTKQKLPFQYIPASGSAQNFTIDLATASAGLDYSSLNTTFQDSHQGTGWERLTKQVQALFFLHKISPKITFSLDKQLKTIAASFDKSPQDAQLIFDEAPTSEGSSSAHIQIKAGVDGLAVNKDSLQKSVVDFLLTGRYSGELPVKTISPTVTTSRVIQAKQALEQTMQEPIKFTFENLSWTLDAKQLLTLLDLTKGNNLLLDKDQAYIYLKKIAAEIDQNVQEGLFEFNPATKRVTAFKPSQEGRRLNLSQTYQLLTDTLSSGSPKTITLPVDIVKPKINTSDVNSLGIKELLGRGISNFAGSIENRIYNVGLTAAKLNGVLVPPGETFSFNQTVGDISAATGFKQAYVIKEGRTVLDDGGGVCQDSTTLFRAVLNAGLPVVKRTAHAYRVGYYEQGFPPGLDATVFYPSVDFQFKNDTPAHILIQAYTSGLTLYVDLYGTPDGREVTLTRPVVSNQTPPPPELRQDDPTLPKGTIKQVDWSAWGANVSFKRIVTKNGQEIINETWRSNYKPWQAVFLVGTQ